MGREMSSLHLLAPLLLTGGTGADLVIRGNIVLNRNHPVTSFVVKISSTAPHATHIHAPALLDLSLFPMPTPLVSSCSNPSLSSLSPKAVVVVR
jgi:hypothetical protein